MDLVDRSKKNGIRVKAWTFDELYGRDGAFLDGLDKRGEAFVGEVPLDFRVWRQKPRILKKRPRNYVGRPKKYPRLRSHDIRRSKVRDLAVHSPVMREQTPQRYLIKETSKGPDVWEIRWTTCWRKTHTSSLVSRQYTLIVARHVLTDEVKYFLSNRVPGRKQWKLRDLLKVAFGRWQVEACFREAKEELGLDHYECRGWRCIHRHLYTTILTGLFCARVRLQLTPSEQVDSGELLTMEQVRRATNTFIQTIGLSPKARQSHYEKELATQQYYSKRSAQAAKAHRKRRLKRLKAIGINPDTIKSVSR